MNIPSKSIFVMWSEKKVIRRPAGDSNPESSDPKSDALSITPTGHLIRSENIEFKEMLSCFFLLIDPFFLVSILWLPLRSS